MKVHHNSWWNYIMFIIRTISSLCDHRVCMFPDMYRLLFPHDQQDRYNISHRVLLENEHIWRADIRRSSSSPNRIV